MATTTVTTRARINRNDWRVVFNAYRKNDNTLFTRKETRANEALYNAAYDWLAAYDGTAPFMLELRDAVENGSDLTYREAAKILNNLIRIAAQ